MSWKLPQDIEKPFYLLDHKFGYMSIKAGAVELQLKLLWIFQYNINWTKLFQESLEPTYSVHGAGRANIKEGVGHNFVSG